MTHIVSDPNYAFGKARIEGTRFTVKDVVGHHFYQGIPLEVIAAKWDLPLAGVYAAIAYYYDHKSEIDQLFDRDEERKPRSNSLLDTIASRHVQ